MRLLDTKHALLKRDPRYRESLCEAITTIGESNKYDCKSTSVPWDSQMPVKEIANPW